MTRERGRREEYSTLLLTLNYIAVVVVVVALSVNAPAEVQYYKEIAKVSWVEGSDLFVRSLIGFNEVIGGRRRECLCYYAVSYSSDLISSKGKSLPGLLSYQINNMPRTVGLQSYSEAYPD